MDYYKYLEPCGDVNCIFGKKDGLTTNGGCQHLKLSPPYTHVLVKNMGSEIYKLRNELKEANSLLRSKLIDYLSNAKQ